MKITTPNEKQRLWREDGFSTGSVDPNWYVSWQQSSGWITENSQAGTTAQRPTEKLYIGRRYFDTSLGAKGKPIWVDKDGTGWVDASGASV